MVGAWRRDSQRSSVAHDLCAAIAIVEVVAEAHHAAGAQIIGTDALRALAAGRVRDGLDALGAARAAHHLDARRRRIHVGDGGM
jgi:hypothetical protein